MMNETMVMQLAKKDIKSSNLTRNVCWGYIHDGVFVRQRVPQPKTFTLDLTQQPLVIAGKSYDSVKQLRHQLLEDSKPRFHDIYGHVIIDAMDRFPCFDSYDSLYENRFYHHLFMMENQQLWYIYYSDDKPNIMKIVEDVDTIDSKVWRKLVHWHLVADEALVYISAL